MALLYNKKVRWIQCIFCMNFLGKKSGSIALLCKAFPEKIPEKILEGKFDHIEKYPGQKNDIVYALERRGTK